MKTFIHSIGLLSLEDKLHVLYRWFFDSLISLEYRKIQVRLHNEFGPIVQSNSPGFESSFQDQEVR